MRYVIPALALLLSTATVVLADSRSVTFFIDGALIEIEAQATRSIARVAISGGAIENTLRIKPVAGTAIQQVDVMPGRIEDKAAKDLDQLQEQKYRLEDRLRALATREEVFKSAAKSQSGKAPRKTKSNPDPMQSIRQGTEFAIAQLEAVYTAKRKTEQDIRRINTRIAARTTSSGADSIAQVSVLPQNGRIKVSYALANQGWTPRYDFRLNGDGTARITLYGQLPGPFTGYLLQAAHGSMAEGIPARRIPVSAGSLARLAEYNLPVSQEHFGVHPATSFSYVLTNPGAAHLPAGEATIYRSGEYLGRMKFEGISSGRTRKISFGG